MTNRRTLACAILFLLALAPRVGFLARFGSPAPGSDAKRHLDCAETIWRHHVYGKTADAPHVADPVLYPIFLAPFVGVFGERPIAALVVQCVLAALCAPMAFVIASRLAGLLAGWAAGLFCAGYVPMFVYTSRFMSATLTIFWLYVALLLAERAFARSDTKGAARWAGALGAMLALLALTRVVTFPLVLVFVALYTIRHFRDLRRAFVITAVCLGAFAVVYSPWVIRNAVVFREFIVLTSKGASKPGSSYRVATFISQGHDLLEARKRSKQLAQELRAKGLPLEPPVGRFSLTYARHCGQRLMIMLGFHPCLPTPYPLTGSTVDFFPPLRWFNYAWHYAMFFFALVALIASVARRDARLFHTIALPGALICLYAMVHAITRYQIPSFAALSIPAGVGVALCRDFIRRRDGARRVVIGLGGNIEPRIETMRQAAERLSEAPDMRVLAVSPVYESEPWGITDQPAFLNAAALIETSLSPEALLDVLMGIEKELGRDREKETRRWGPRPIDLDILFIEGRAVRSARLSVPHPRLYERNFALRPLLDVAPDATDPRDGKPLREHLNALNKGGLELFAASLADGDHIHPS